MTTRQINSMLYLGAAVLGVAALASLAALITPLDGASPTQNAGLMRSPSTAPAANADKAELAMLTSLEPVLSRPLRGKTDNASAAPIRSAATPTSRAVVPTLMLVGTIGDSTALLRTPEGNVVAKSIGEHIGDAELVAVRGTEADIRVNGHVTTLRKPGEPVNP